MKPHLLQRRGVIAGVAAAAALAGGGFAWWRTRAPGGGGDRADMLWPLKFDMPQARTLEMQSLRGKPLVVNFWATWCPPCVEEMPLLDAFFRQNSAKGWQVIGLAIDQPSAVRTFLARTPVSYPIGFAGLEGTELGRNLGNLTGGLPFTVVVGSSGEVLQRKMGRLTSSDIAAWSGLR